MFAQSFSSFRNKFIKMNLSDVFAEISKTKKYNFRADDSKERIRILTIEPLIEVEPSIFQTLSNTFYNMNSNHPSHEKKLYEAITLRCIAMG